MTKWNGWIHKQLKNIFNSNLTTNKLQFTYHQDWYYVLFGSVVSHKKSQFIFNFERSYLLRFMSPLLSDSGQGKEMLALQMSV